MVNKNLNLSSDNKNRRLDSFTRQTINELQVCFYDPDSTERAYAKTLNYLVGVTISDYAACFTVDNAQKFTELGQLRLKKLISTTEDKDVFNTEALTEWINTGQLLHPVFINSPMSEHWQGLLAPDTKVNSLMIVPIFVHLELRAVFLLTKTQSTFSSYVLKRIKPVIASTACAVHSSESVDSDYLGLNQELFGREFVDTLLASSPSGIIVVGEDNKIVNSNPIAQDIFYHIKDNVDEDHNCSLENIDIKEFIPNFDDLFQWSNQPDKTGLEQKAIIPNIWNRVVAKNKFGEPRILNLTVFRFRKGKRLYSILQIQDITIYENTANNYKQASQQFQALTYLVPVGIIQVDDQWNCTLTNEKWSEITGLNQAESEHHGWINAIHFDDIQDTLAKLYYHLNDGADFNREIRLVNVNGSVTWVDFSIRVLSDNNNNITGFIGTFTDVTDRYVNKEKLRVAAEYDGLTGLTNRNKFHQLLERALESSARDKELVTVFFLDLDGFKDVNDTLGHDAGDLVLKAVAERLINLLRKTDTVSRFGGDEFVILIGHNDTPTDIIKVADKIINSVSQPYKIKNQTVFLTTSVGIAQGYGEEISANELLKYADSALYRAKRSGKNKLEVYSSSFDEENRQRVMLQNELRGGLSDDQYNLVFQPIFDCKSNEFVAAEALLRFKTHQDENISPDKFIPILEETNMIIDVGRWVVVKLCERLKEFLASSSFPDSAYITINVSAKELLHPDFTTHFLNCIKSHDIPPRCIVMEITESVLINKPEKIKSILNILRQNGVRIALDDFGTGYSSLSYLQKFPIDILKIDRTFIDDLSENSNDAKITKSIIALAKSLDLKVVAEGVETQFALDALNKLDAEMVQGFYLCKPLTFQQINKYLAPKKRAG
ncbi:sensor domain-containing protein [Glaciecola sp. 1036]|uniref:sensor domain-containing protein n=1 Tax=Alteromonadaceae TaxID=72275 RepID=UPI003CFF3367